MKKFVFATLPVLAVSLLAACGGSKESYQVDEAHYNSALAFEGVNYLQTNFSNNPEGSNPSVGEFSPNVYHFKDDGEGRYSESYYRKNATDVDVWHKDAKDAEWEKSKETLDHFPTPHSPGHNMKDILDNLGVHYSDFKYYPSDKYYEAVKEYPTDPGFTNTFKLFFVNNKISKLYVIGRDEESGENWHHYAFTYNQITPTPPASDYAA